MVIHRAFTVQNKAIIKRNLDKPLVQQAVHVYTVFVGHTPTYAWLPLSMHIKWEVCVVFPFCCAAICTLVCLHTLQVSWTWRASVIMAPRLYALATDLPAVLYVLHITWIIYAVYCLCYIRKHSITGDTGYKKAISRLALFLITGNAVNLAGNLLIALCAAFSSASVSVYLRILYGGLSAFSLSHFHFHYHVSEGGPGLNEGNSLWLNTLAWFPEWGNAQCEIQLYLNDMYIRMHLLIVMCCMYKILSNRVELKVYVFIIYICQGMSILYTLSTYTHVHICLWYTLQSMSYIINFAFFHV